MQPNQANVEYFYRLLYECLRGKCGASIDTSSFSAFLAHLWLIIIVLGYLLAVVALIMIIYALVRLFELRKKEEEFYGTVIVAPEEAGGINPRWKHIESLIATENPNDWRAAIVEADIMLDDMLTRQGYAGEGVGEKLKNVERSDFQTLEDAWEAHKVRNQIAHEGTNFDLSDVLARRTVARYENVFHEFHLI
jgi:hypothetical protein